MKHGKYGAERPHEVKVRMSEDEFGKLSRDTAMSGYSREEYLRRVISGARVVQAHPENLTAAIVRLRETEGFLRERCTKDGIVLSPDEAEQLLMRLYSAEKSVSESCS